MPLATIFWASNCESAGERAAIVLREKNVDFEFRHIEPDNRPDWFLAISPHKKVPVLRVDDRVSLFESNAIAEYLAVVGDNVGDDGRAAMLFFEAAGLAVQVEKPT